MSAEEDTGSGQVTSLCDWMSQLPGELHNIPLRSLAIPGSHDSMSYDLDINSSIIEPVNLKGLSKIYLARRIVHRWAVTQEESITKQLDAGVRYFDLRIARKSNDTDPTRLYFYHGLRTRTDVETVLEMIHDWSVEHPKEILILALSHFKGFKKHKVEQLHIHLISFIKTLFGTKLLHRVVRNPEFWNIPTLKSCWDSGRNVIVSYDYSANQHPEMWGRIPYYYGDSMDPAEVESKLCQGLVQGRCSQGFYVCGLNLTLPEDARILRYIFRPRDSLTKVLKRSLPKLLQWVKRQTSERPNIVASDLVTRDNFVSTVVQLNISKLEIT
ncbi:PI-PLC X domain-containing protein 1-like [Limanda limanda]|uniref:PI-PLC X domain-containing protein 1-like n=1 Tax=Limanda limanda TaxID=27771 RepID=UPI0029C7098B|nr:PI-PLC X domain-containing protein 1-like [Limanda limanda]